MKEHCCIFEDFIVGLLADSVMLCDTLYAKIGEQVVLRCPYTSHDVQSQWRNLMVKQKINEIFKNMFYANLLLR
jgi:hypothetical protein